MDMNIPEGRALLQCSSALQPFTTNDPFPSPSLARNEAIRLCCGGTNPWDVAAAIFDISGFEPSRDWQVVQIVHCFGKNSDQKIIHKPYFFCSIR